MSPKQVLGDVFEQLKGQVGHAAQVMKQEPVKLAQNLLGESDEAAEESESMSQPQVDPQQLQMQQQIARMRQLDEARKRESLRGLRQQQAVMARWDNERKAREMRERQQQAQEQQQAGAKKQEKQQIKQLERRDKAEVLSVKRAQNQVEAKMGKF
ncbi:MAG: hypothetical protein A2784_00825 [Candidatus Chisholmbacteria bacterium RIFCSPHIGHO2_01_FULL_48_12]|uniref:Uncharacterized protein n=1 Tax=Candidatus Chisholmbacteria bacterium RIFCSPHIGHO2_01_FULL_48_12 TaxID=1797589 RepID=A0A1G1VQP1_9BACT|nr:MAG: hypothetical protein A2784_00825 [Candidatus Chisholmbacteria bacterium RIFCSPHIGHO2_01_FULL_48_12]